MKNFSMIAVLMLLSAACSNSRADEASGDRALSRADRVFVDNAVVSGQREVEHGRLAETRASNSAVKDYAAHLVAAHTATNDELTTLLERKQISLTQSSSQRDDRGSIGSKDDATTATKTGGKPTGAPNVTGSTGAAGTVATTGEALDRERAGMTYPWMHADGFAFDEGFIATQIKMHQDAIALFVEQTTTGADPELKAFAEKHLPALREHLRQAQELQQTTRQTP